MAKIRFRKAAIVFAGMIGAGLGFTVHASAQTNPGELQPASGVGQTLQGKQCLSLETVMTLSARRDPSVLLAQAERVAADADLAEARSLFRPQVSTFARTGVGDVGLVDSALQNQIGLRASQRVYDFGDARFARQAAQFSQTATRFTEEQAKGDAALQTGIAALNALEAKERITISQERASYFERQLRSLDELLADGGTTITERASVASRLAEARAIIVELELQREQAKQRVTIDTGLAAPMCGTDTQANYLRGALGVFPDVETAIVSAIANNPSSKALQNRVQSEEALVRRQRAQRFPIVEVVGISAFSTVGPLDDLSQQNRIGLDVSLPLYSGGAQSARLARASAQEAAASARVAENRRELELNVSAAYARIASLSELLERRNEVVEQSEIRFNAANAQFGFGAMALPELIESRIEFENAQREAVVTKFDLLRQYIELLGLTAQFELGV